MAAGGGAGRGFLCAPSRALRGEPADVSCEEELHPPRAVAFAPDPSFYHAECCEGLWVCCSHKVDEEVRRRAAHLCRSLFPEQLRGLFGRFRSPKWATDPGPMRLIILDHVANEQAGSIPELQGTALSDMRGRNHTHCPWVFTSSSDFASSDAARWGKLTAHELTHGADMVIRQLCDPYFHEEVQALYDAAEERSRDGAGDWRDRGASMPAARVDTLHAAARERDGARAGADPAALPSYDFGGRYRGGLYCMANRDEYLAECHCMALGMADGICGEPPTALDHAKRAGLCSADGLQRWDPALLALLRRHFIVPLPGVDWAPCVPPPAAAPPPTRKL